MKIRDIMTKNVISVSPDDTLSRAITTMKQHNIHQVVVWDDKLSGMLELKNIVTKKLDLSTAKVSGYYNNVPSVNPTDNIESATKFLFDSGFRALPVMDENKIVGIISETDLLKVAKKLDYKVSDIMTECEYVTKTEKIGKVKHIMTYRNVSRVPVLDNGNIIGMIGTLDMIKIIENRGKYAARGGRLKETGTKEKLQIDDVESGSVMTPVKTVNKNLSLDAAIELLQKNEEVVVSDGGKAFIVTPKDILEIIMKKPEKGIYVQITNLSQENDFTKEKIDSAITEFVRKIGKILNGVQSFNVYIERHCKQGKKIKYSVRTRVMTPLGLFVSHAWGWDLISVSQEAMSKIEKEILKRHEKVRGHLKKTNVMKKRF